MVNDRCPNEGDGAPKAIRMEEAVRRFDLRTSAIRRDLSAMAVGVVLFGASVSTAAADQNDAATATPIRHVIIIIGENRTFDHVFATYEPFNKGEAVLNLLSEGIVKPDGSPGPNYGEALQYRGSDTTAYQLAPLCRHALGHPRSTSPKNFGGGSYVNCADEAQPGVRPILNYLSSLARPVPTKCNYNTGYFGDGSNAYVDPNPSNSIYTIPPPGVETIGAELSAKAISWAYYGDGFDLYLKDK
jgi:hypothetical protein